MELVEPFLLEQTSNPIQFRKRTFDFMEFFLCNKSPTANILLTYILYILTTIHTTITYLLFNTILKTAGSSCATRIFFGQYNFGPRKSNL